MIKKLICSEINLSSNQRSRYDFLGDKIDLSRFQKHVKRGISRKYLDLDYDIYFENYKLFIAINTHSDHVSFCLFKIIKDKHGDITNLTNIAALDDNLFQHCNDLTRFYDANINHYLGGFTEPDADKLVDNLSNIIKTVFKIDNLKLFV